VVSGVLVSRVFHIARDNVNVTVLKRCGDIAPCGLCVCGRHVARAAGSTDKRYKSPREPPSAAKTPLTPHHTTPHHATRHVQSTQTKGELQCPNVPPITSSHGGEKKRETKVLLLLFVLCLFRNKTIKHYLKSQMTQKKQGHNGMHLRLH